MRYTVRESTIHVVGDIWMPSVTCGQCLTLRPHDVENMRGEDGKITRDSVQSWLDCHAGDFSRILDFWASIEDGDETIDIPWATEEGETAYLDATAGDC